MVRAALVVASTVLILGGLAWCGARGRAATAPPPTFTELAATVSERLERASPQGDDSTPERHPDLNWGPIDDARLARTVRECTRMCLRFGAESGAPVRERRAANVLAAGVSLRGTTPLRREALARLQGRAGFRADASGTRGENVGTGERAAEPLDDLDVLECFLESSLLCAVADAERNPQGFVDALVPLQRLLDAPVTAPDLEDELLRPLLRERPIDLDAPVEHCVALRIADISSVVAERLADSDAPRAKSYARSALAGYRRITETCPQKTIVFAKAQGRVMMVDRHSFVRRLAEDRE